MSQLLLRAQQLLLLPLLLALSCKPKVGGACELGEARCVDGRSELVCEDGKFVETPCRGKAGCATLQELTACDISGNQPGDGCSKADQGAAACADASGMIACHDRKFEHMACRGPGGCETVAGQPKCDQAIGAVGEACNLPNATSCSLDRGSVLSCREGRFTPLYACRGEAGCSVAAGRLSCDQSVAREHDACDPALDGMVACSEDRSGLLTCQAERFVASTPCQRGTSCAVSGQTAACTPSH